MKNEKQELRYTTIIHNIRIEIGLSCNEYCVADIIYHLSNNPSNKIKGWCYASKETLAKFMGITKQAIHQIINRLIEIGLIYKDKETKYLQTTELWYKSIVLMKIKYSKENIPIVKKVYHRQERNFTPYSKESLHNNNIYNNIDKINSKATALQTNKKESILIKKKNQEITELFDYYKQEFKKMTGKTPIFNWGKCVKLAKPHLETLGLKTMKHLVYCYLYETKGEDRKFFKENVWSLSCFLSANTINKINLKYYESN